MQSCAAHLGGRVLDYGAGKQPYRNIVEAVGGEYIPHDLTSYPSNVSEEDWPLAPPHRYDAILCTQVLQYVPIYRDLPDADHGEPYVATPLWDLLDGFRTYLSLGGDQGWLILTGGTCWREIEPADHSRLTANGAFHLLREVGFHVERCESRASINFPGFSMSLGWGALAHA